MGTSRNYFLFFAMKEIYKNEYSSNNKTKRTPQKNAQSNLAEQKAIWASKSNSRDSNSAKEEELNNASQRSR